MSLPQHPTGNIHDINLANLGPPTYISCENCGAPHSYMSACPGLLGAGADVTVERHIWGLSEEDNERFGALLDRKDDLVLLEVDARIPVWNAQEDNGGKGPLAVQAISTYLIQSDLQLDFFALLMQIVERTWRYDEWCRCSFAAHGVPPMERPSSFFNGQARFGPIRRIHIEHYVPPPSAADIPDLKMQPVSVLFDRLHLAKKAIERVAAGGRPFAVWEDMLPYVKQYKYYH